LATQAGAVMSYHRNPKAAGQDAARKALTAAGIEKPDFSFVFATVGYDQQVVLTAVREATHGAPLCGCSGEGVIAGDEADESNFSVAVMAISSDQLRFNHGIVTGLKADSGEAGRSIARVIRPEVKPDTLALFLFPDGITLNFDRLLGGLEGELCLDRLLPVVGGTAGDNLQFQRSYQYCDDQVVSDGAAWALLSGEAEIALAVNHSCVPVGVEHKVTRCEGNVICEIDGRPTLEVLKDYLTDEGVEEWVMAVLSFPLGLTVPGLAADYDEYIIRAMVGGRDDATGSVTIPTEVTEGMSIWLTRRDREKLVVGIERAIQDIKAQLGDNPPRLVFQFDCAGRGNVFLREQQKLQLLKTLRQQLGPDAPWVGFYTFGEIGPVGERNYFHNYTVVLTVVF
jgi:hypothetical protein